MLNCHNHVISVQYKFGGSQTLGNTWHYYKL